MLLPVPHHPQEQKATCLPASFRMVLSYLGIERDELSLSWLFKTHAGGTPTDNFAAIEIPGIKIVAENMDLALVRESIQQGQPVVVYLYTEPLPYWNTSSAHAVVVVGYEEESFFVNDPMFPDAPKKIDVETFLEAWDMFNNFGIVIKSSNVRLKNSDEASPLRSEHNVLGNQKE
ncbi:MAG: C39 family peptidase [Candidatus Poribacteria bacterium]